MLFVLLIVLTIVFVIFVVRQLLLQRRIAERRAAQQQLLETADSRAYRRFIGRADAPTVERSVSAPGVGKDA